MSRSSSTAADRPFKWEELAERVADYLRTEGVPAGQVERLSHSVVRLCADAADSMTLDDLHSNAMDEARTLLETWHATRREHLLADV